MPAAGATLLEGRMAEAIIGGTLLLVFQDVVGFVDFLELRLAVLVAGIAVRMPLHRQLAIGGLELAIACGALDLEDFVKIALGHQIRVPVPESFRQKYTPGLSPGVFCFSIAPRMRCRSRRPI